MNVMRQNWKSAFDILQSIERFAANYVFITTLSCPSVLGGFSVGEKSEKKNPSWQNRSKMLLTN